MEVCRPSLLFSAVSHPGQARAAPSHKCLAFHRSTVSRQIQQASFTSDSEATYQDALPASAVFMSVTCTSPRPAGDTSRCCLSSKLLIDGFKANMVSKEPQDGASRKGFFESFVSSSGYRHRMCAGAVVALALWSFRGDQEAILTIYRHTC